MARQVTGSAAQYLSCDTGEALSYPFTLSCRFKPVGAPKHTLSYGKYDISTINADVESIYGIATNIAIYTFDTSTYSAATLPTPITPGRWYLAVAVLESASKRTIYLDNSTQTATDLSAQPVSGLTPKPITVGGLMTLSGFYPAGAENFDGEVADVAIWNTALTAADVDHLASHRPGDIKATNLKGWWKLGADGSLANSAGTYGPMVVTGTCPVTADPLYGDPLSVPKAYVPNEELTWVQKATHIWPLHPNNPLKADKGTIGLELVTGSVAVPAAMPDNTMEFHGGDPSTASYYKTAASIIFGDNPAVVGNQTPPTIGAVSFWFDTYTGTPAGGFSIRIFGPQAVSTGASAQIHHPASTGTLVGAVQFTSNSGITPPQNTWIHVCLTHNGTHRRLFVNGVKVNEGTNVSTATMGDLVYGIGCSLGAGSTPVAFTGRMRLVSMINGAEWTDAEILEQAQRPYGYYKPDPTSVPAFYTPNEELSWVEKATHIWALHPSNPLKADKGGKTLELVTGTQPVPVAQPDNTMQFSGGADAAASFYQTIDDLLFSSATHGGIAFWIYPTSYDGTFTRMAGQPAVYYSALLSYHSAGYIVPDFGSQYLGAAFTPPLNQWTHLAVTREVSSYARLYVNGVEVDGRGTTAYGTIPQKFQIAQVLYTDGYGNAGVNGRLRLVAVVSDDIWTGAEILEMYQRPYGYYIPDPTGVPDDYIPNLELSWAAKATHIWAVHPNDPLKADKGGMTLQEVTRGSGGTAPTPLASPENTMQFYGAHETAAIWYATIGDFIFGDDPLTPGAQTPPMIGGMSGWFYLYSYAEYLHFIGMANAASNGLTVPEGAHLMTRASSGAILCSAGSVTVTGLVGGQPALNTWVHIAVTNDATYRRLYVNGVKIGETAQNSGAGVSLPFNIGHTVYASAAQRFTFNGRIRLVAVTQGVSWTDAEILEQYQRPYGYYTGTAPSFVGIEAGEGVFALAGQPATLRVARRLAAASGSFIEVGEPASLRVSRLLSSGVGVFELNKPPVDPTSVPAVYTPNASLSWVQKATHIWALHPNDPLKADRGGLTLEPVIGTQPAPSAQPDNTMEFHGGMDAASSYYRTIGSFVFGDNPVMVGNQTPPVIGAMSCWVQIYGPGRFQGFIGGLAPENSGHLFTNQNATPLGYVGGLTFFGNLPLNSWVHLTLTNDATWRRLYVNGVKVTENAQTSLIGADESFLLGKVGWGNPGQNMGLNGRLRQVAVINGAVWTDAEILEQYQRPYGYYAAGGVQAGIAILRLVRRIQGDPGVFALDGGPVDLRTQRLLLAGHGEFLLTGEQAMLKHFIPTRGAGRTFYVAKNDRIYYVPPDTDVRDT